MNSFITSIHLTHKPMEYHDFRYLWKWNHRPHFHDITIIFIYFVFDQNIRRQIIPLKKITEYSIFYEYEDMKTKFQFKLSLVAIYIFF